MSHRFTILAPYPALQACAGYLLCMLVPFLMIRQPALVRSFPWQFVCPGVAMREERAERGHQASEVCERCPGKEDCEQRATISTCVMAPDEQPVILCHSSYLGAAADRQGVGGGMAVRLADALFHDRHVVLDEEHLSALVNAQEITAPHLQEYTAVLSGAFSRGGRSKAAVQAWQHLRLAELAMNMVREMPPGPFSTTPWAATLLAMRQPKPALQNALKRLPGRSLFQPLEALSEADEAFRTEDGTLVVRRPPWALMRARSLTLLDATADAEAINHALYAALLGRERDPERARHFHETYWKIT